MILLIELLTVSFVVCMCIVSCALAVFLVLEGIAAYRTAQYECLVNMLNLYNFEYSKQNDPD